MSEFKVPFLENVALLLKTKEELVEMVDVLYQENQELKLKHSNSYLSSKESKRSFENDIAIWKQKYEEVNLEYQKQNLEFQKLKHIIDLKLGTSYNPNGTRTDKIIFVLKAAQRPLSLSEICDILCKHDESIKHLEFPKKKISLHLNNALNSGRVIAEKAEGKNYNLYSLPVIHKPQ